MTVLAPPRGGLVEAVHANLIEGFATLGHALPGGDVAVVEDWATVVLTGVPEAEFNRAFVVGPGTPPAGALDELMAYFAPHRVSWTLVVTEPALEALRPAIVHSNLKYPRTIPGMVVDLPAREVPAPDGLEIEAITSQAMADVFAAAVGSGFGNPPGFSAVFGHAGAWDAPGNRCYLAWMDGQLAGTAAVYASGGVAGISNVSVQVPFRRQGIGEALTRAAMTDGYEMGADVAALQASAMGRPLYERMGFRELVRYRAWYSIAGA